jgi:glucose-1-phosphate adenylyltransferase
MMSSLPNKAAVLSRLPRDTLALILAGGRGDRLKDLTRWRTKPAVPFAGKFRIIDFTLSNCVNSGIRRICVLTQYKAHSLLRHLQLGWTILSNQLGEFIDVLPASQRVANEWYSGTADAVYQNLDILRTHDPGYVLVLGGDHIYKMDYGQLLAAHVEREADMTVGSIEVPLVQASSFGVMAIDANYRITRFQEKPAEPPPMPGAPDTALASMGIYVFNTEFLYEQLIRDADSAESTHDFGKDIVPWVVERYAAYAFPFRDPMTGRRAYWRDVGTVDAYWHSNMEMIDVTPELNLYDRDWPIWTYQEQLAPAKFVFDEDGRRGMAVSSMVSGGCILSGAEVRRSLLFSNVHVESYSVLTECVVLPDVKIGTHCRLQRAIIDKGSIIPSGTAIGVDHESDRKRFHVSEGGIVLVTPESLGQGMRRLR